METDGKTKHIALNATYNNIREKLSSIISTGKIKERFIDNISNVIIIKYIDELIDIFNLDIETISNAKSPLYSCSFIRTLDYIIFRLSEPDFVMVKPEFHNIIATICVNKLIEYMEKSYSLKSLKSIIIEEAFLSGLLEFKITLKSILNSDIGNQFNHNLSDSLHGLHSMIIDIYNLIKSNKGEI